MIAGPEFTTRHPLLGEWCRREALDCGSPRRWRANRRFGSSMRESRFRRILWLVAILAMGPVLGLYAAETPPAKVVYTNVVIPSEPWSIHLVKVPRSGGAYEIHSRHAKASALGLSVLSRQIGGVDPGAGQPVAAINGGFYRRDRIYPGAARGLQIVTGEVLSAPNGGPTFWIDLAGEPHFTNVTSQFQITWPDGKT